MRISSLKASFLYLYVPWRTIIFPRVIVRSLLFAAAGADTVVVPVSNVLRREIGVRGVGSGACSSFGSDI